MLQAEYDYSIVKINVDGDSKIHSTAGNVKVKANIKIDFERIEIWFGRFLYRGTWIDRRHIPPQLRKIKFVGVPIQSKEIN